MKKNYIPNFKKNLLAHDEIKETQKLIYEISLFYLNNFYLLVVQIHIYEYHDGIE